LILVLAPCGAERCRIKFDVEAGFGMGIGNGKLEMGKEVMFHSYIFMRGMRGMRCIINRHHYRFSAYTKDFSRFQIFNEFNLATENEI
jgi:hypothetical protein